MLAVGPGYYLCKHFSLMPATTVRVLLRQGVGKGERDSKRENAVHLINKAMAEALYGGVDHQGANITQYTLLQY